MFFKVYVVEKIKKKNTIVFHLQCKKNDHAIVKGKVLFYLWLFAYKCLVIYIKIKTIKHVNKTKRMYLIQRQNFHNKAFVLISNTLILTYNWHKKLYPNLFFCFLNYFKINTNYLFLFQLYLFQKKKKYKHTLNFLLDEIKKSSDCFENLQFKKLKSIKHSLFYKDYEYLNLYIKKKITNVNNFLNYKLLEQNNTIEHVYDSLTHTQNAYNTINYVKSKKNHLYQYNKTKFIILIYWICLIIALIFTRIQA